MNKTNNPYPENLLSTFVWGFMDRAFATQKEFESEARQYQLWMTKKNTFKPSEVIFPFPQIAVGYMYWENETEVDAFAEFVADNGESFTAGELMFKIHNAVFENLRDMDHHFFEGLSFHKVRESTGLPLYHMRLGS